MNDTDPTVAATEPSIEGAATAAGPAGYQLGAVIGRGGMGEVLLAHDADIGRDVALKRMKAATPDLIERFLREARIQARLDHPAIVPVHEVGRDREGRPYFTMKRVTGTTLALMLERGGESLQRLLRAFVEVCLATDFAHSRGVVHRDLKPSNIMLGDYGEVYVLDWGIARVLGQSEPTHANTPSTETQVGTVLGTPGYMAPEQREDSKVGPSADVYSLGKILHDILRGKPDVPPELESICTAALADDPAARPTARALGNAVQAYLDGDRDLERRRQLASEQVAAAQRAREDGRRSEAIRAAGRALALDPNAVEAGELLSSMIVEVPKELPPEVESGIGSVEREIVRERSRRSTFLYLAIWLTLPVAAAAHVVSWALLAAVYTIATAIAGVHWFNYKTARVPAWVFMTANLALVVAFAQFTGAFVLTPLLVATLLVAYSSRPEIARRPWLVFGYGIVASLLPIALEKLGALPPTFRFDSEGLVTWANGVARHTTGGFVLLAGGVAILVTLTGRYAMGITRARFDTQRHMHIQAWQLRQLLPRARTSRSE